MQISETLLLFITAIITAVAAFFCLIALATPGWSAGFGLFCRWCQTAPAALSIIALLLLVLAAVILLICALRKFPQSLRILILLVLFLATIFTLATYASYVDKTTGYSFKLMVFAHFLSYIASISTAFWLGGSHATRLISPNNA